MNDCMIDLETASTHSDAKILAIGAVLFDRKSGETGDSFYVRLDPRITPGHISPSTLKWWKEQSAEAYAEAWGGEVDPFTAVRKLFRFLKVEPRVWGNGASFDITILENLIRSAGYDDMPWKFWDVRDLRTLVDVAEVNPRSFKFEGVVHNALDDALHQVKIAAACFRKINS